jgi:hypothetical protein
MVATDSLDVVTCLSLREHDVRFGEPGSAQITRYYGNSSALVGGCGSSLGKFNLNFLVPNSGKAIFQIKEDSNNAWDNGYRSVD